MGSGGLALPHALVARRTRCVARRRRDGVAATRAVTEPGLATLRGVGPELAKRFAANDVHSPRDLAALVPRDYRDWRTPLPVGRIVHEALARVQTPDDPDSAEVIAVGELANVREQRARVPILTGDLTDGSGRIKLTWFGRRGLRLSAGDRLFVYGRAQTKFVRGAATVELNVLNHRVLAPDEEYVGSIVPVYRASKELPSRTIAGIIERNFEDLAEFATGVVPAAILQQRGYPAHRDAWRRVHRPATPDEARIAREQLIYEEFFGIALGAAVERARRRADGGAPELHAPARLLGEFEAALPFALTGAQRRVIDEIYGDMAQGAPMNRLLQGDVGSGKTLVAAAAIVLAARAGVQSALMAPTEILATQHAAKLAPLLLSLGLRTDVLVGSVGQRDRTRVRDRLASGEADVAIGTHALIEDDIAFRRLGLVIVDEQHRFGVMQRAKLRAKGTAPHTLSMTATPIPRTLAQTKYADLDVSIIDELPPGRTPVETFVLRESRKPLAYEFVRKNVARGRQAYVVVPAIDESESALTSALGELEHLRTDVFPELRVALLHGRLPSREKDAVMQGFARGEADVMLATTVVEVGVDVANAGVMVILDADRYGLAQLHQLRGRVGRGSAHSYCVLVAPEDRQALPRLEILASTTDGFAIAEADLALRSAGEFAGSAQAGTGSELLGNLVHDFAIYERARDDAAAIALADPRLEFPDHRPLRDLLDDNAGKRAMFLSS